MQADAYRRARKLLSSSSPNAPMTAGFLGVVHSLLMLSLFGIAGLLVALLDTHGESRYPTSRMASFPKWMSQHPVAGTDIEFTLHRNTGLFPLVAGNLYSPNPLHRRGAELLSWVMRRAPMLRNNRGALTTLLAVGLGLLVTLCVVAQARRSVLAEAVSSMATSLRSQIHRQMYRLGQSSLPTEGTGPVVNLFSREVNDIRDGIFSDLDLRLRTVVLGVGLLALALFLSPFLTIFLISLGVLVWMTTGFMLRDARRVSDAAIRDASVQLCLLHEDLGLLRTVRVFGMENFDKQRFEEHLERFREADARRIKTEGRLNPTFGLLFGSAAILALGLLCYATLEAHGLSFAAVVVLVASLAGLVHPVLEWLNLRQSVRQGARSAAAVFEFLERRPELQQQGGASFLPPLQDRISFENVTLESRSGRVLLEGVSAEFPAGSRTAIMSLEEDAKQALVCLIPRLIDPKVGRVRIDGQDLRDVTLESIRAQVATVLQADLVFTDSIAVNIGLGDPSFPMPRIIEAAKVAHAHNFIQELPHGYDTVIGQLGHYLSIDEQYRIALARAYLHDPSIVIIEEPNVTLDDDTKHLIDDTVARLAQGRTLIILPHRLSTIRSCNQIIVLQNGRIESIGQPRQLQNESKLYRHIQYVEFNQFATGDIEAGQMNA
ncbi:MAG: ATP-binding cassette, subfamily bacterial [Actinomycetota bacterium]|nr:ATP-binding cassette, subfamily bacterial [Actinomycetota bacterium]